jgi:hypothetical protein
VVAVLAASVFGHELFLMRFYSADNDGLEGHYHWLLQVVVTASVLATAASIVVLRSFVVRSALVLFQGLWFVVMGCTQWVPALVPRHGFGEQWRRHEERCGVCNGGGGAEVLLLLAPQAALLHLRAAPPGATAEVLLRGVQAPR